MPQVAFNWIAATVGTLLICLPPPLLATVDERTRVALEALSRLKDSDLETNPTLKQAVLKVLEQVRGEPEFVEVVRDFRLSGQEAELLRLALRYPTSPLAPEAVRLVLATPKAPGLSETLRGDKTAAMVDLLGATGDHRGVRWLEPLVLDLQQSLEVRRATVAALAKTEEGANSLLALEMQKALPPDLRVTAGKALRATRWPKVLAAAALAFPTEPAKELGSLPSLGELLQMTSDSTKGAAIFRRPEVACITCHQVNGEGIDFGPKLSEIGSKLGQDALMTAILEPSAGISFGFEAWRIELKNGDELFGMVVSDTEEEVVVKQQGGQVQRVKKSEVAYREKQPLSIMPAGLQQNLSAQEFVDLIAYLSSLKKADSPAP